jgi:gamma-glutamyltranspeptidase
MIRNQLMVRQLGTRAARRRVFDITLWGKGMDYDNIFSPRSNVMAMHGMVATSQPLAAMAGLEILRMGGNAADAAVATAAMLNVVEPISTGVGGDMFALFWDAATRTVRALNGSGRAAKDASVEVLRQLGYSQLPRSRPVPRATGVLTAA